MKPGERQLWRRAQRSAITISVCSLWYGGPTQAVEGCGAWMAFEHEQGP